MATRLHDTLYLNYSKFSRTQTNFIHAWNTSCVGPGMGEHWFGMDEAKSFTRLNLSVLSRCLWYVYHFYPSRAKNFLLCEWALSVI